MDPVAPALTMIFYSVATRHQNDLKAFWQTMSFQEAEHVEYWEELLDLAKEGMIPQVFDKPFEVKKELEGIYLKANELLTHAPQVSTLLEAFMLAYKLEFYVLHPAFGSLFHFIHTVSTEKSPEDDYESHLSSLANHLSKYGAMTPQLELISEIIVNLWRRNCELVHQSHTDPLTEVHNRRGFFHVVTPLAYLAKNLNRWVQGDALVDLVCIPLIASIAFGFYALTGVLRMLSPSQMLFMAQNDSLAMVPLYFAGLIAYGKAVKLCFAMI